MDTISDIEIEQTPFTFVGDEQALLALVDRAVHNLRGRRINYYPIDPDRESVFDAAWIERYAETVRGIEVRRLRAIWIGTHSVERSNWTGPILSFGYRCAYIDRPDDDDAASIELRRRGIRQRETESEQWRLHVKLPKVTGNPIKGTIEAPALLRFAVDAILLAIEEAGREVQTDAPTGDATSDDAGREVQAAAPLSIYEGLPNLGQGTPEDWTAIFEYLRERGIDPSKFDSGKIAQRTGKAPTTVEKNKSHWRNGTWPRSYRKSKKS